jgi:hypothetical protein
VDDAALIAWAERLAAAAQAEQPLDLTPPRLDSAG